MELIVHLSDEKRGNLKKTAAKLHADTVIRAVRQLSLPPERKLQLLDGILRSRK